VGGDHQEASKEASGWDLQNFITFADFDPEVAAQFKQFEELLTENGQFTTKQGWQKHFQRPDEKKFFQQIKPDPSRPCLMYGDLWPEEDPNCQILLRAAMVQRAKKRQDEERQKYKEKKEMEMEEKELKATKHPKTNSVGGKKSSAVASTAAASKPEEPAADADASTPAEQHEELDSESRPMTQESMGSGDQKTELIPEASLSGASLGSPTGASRTGDSLPSSPQPGAEQSMDKSMLTSLGESDFEKEESGYEKEESDFEKEEVEGTPSSP